MVMDKTQWAAEEIRALREELKITNPKDGERVTMNQTMFGELLGGYIQPTISGWEDLNVNKDGTPVGGCKSRRGVKDLNALQKKFTTGKLRKYA